MGKRNKFALRKSEFNGKYLRKFDTSEEAISYLKTLWEEYNSSSYTLKALAEREILKGIYLNAPLLSKYFKGLGLKTKIIRRKRKPKDLSHQAAYVSLEKRHINLLRRFPKGTMGIILGMLLRAITGGNTDDFVILFLDKKTTAIFHERDGSVSVILPKAIKPDLAKMCQGLANASKLYGLEYVSNFAKTSGYQYLGGHE